MLTRQGYVIQKSQLATSDLQRIRRDLRVRAAYDVDKSYGPPPPYFKVYHETSDSMVLPRFYAIPVFGEPSCQMKDVESCPTMHFEGQLRQGLNQHHAASAGLQALRTKGGGMLCLPTGYGKTSVALYIASQMQTRTLIVVHKTCLLDQWLQRINQFLPNATTGLIQGSKVDVEGKDIVLVMLQTAVSREYGSDLLAGFGMVIVDECHHIGAAVFSQVMMQVNCPYVLGLSATPNRKDGLSNVIHWFLGDIFYQMQRQSSKDVLVQVVPYDSPSYRKDPPLTQRGKLNMAALVTTISEDEARNQVLKDVILQHALTGRHMLVLSDRRAQSEALCRMCKDAVPCALYLGSMKADDLKHAEAQQVMFSTYAMCGEGFDKFIISCLVMATPKSDVNQACGRVLREGPGKEHHPLIVDVRDNFGVFHAQFRKRESFYKSQGFSLTRTVSEQASPAVTYMFQS